ncbi:hypothetical protein BT69DRAFT_1341843 [Atractiella rhizophila]|nr:hypothetical protein BT69DRAFT_1341843 [Atractiella rhizophila]
MSQALHRRALTMKIDVKGIFTENGRPEDNPGSAPFKVFSKFFKNIEDINPHTWHKAIAKLPYVMKCDEYHVIQQGMTVDIKPVGGDYTLDELQKICALYFICEGVIDQIRANYPKEDVLYRINDDTVSFSDSELSAKVGQILTAATASELASLICRPQQKRRYSRVNILLSSNDTMGTIQFYQYHGTWDAKEAYDWYLFAQTVVRQSLEISPDRIRQYALSRREAIAYVLRLLANSLEEAEQKAVVQQLGDQAAEANDICGNDSCWRVGTA